MTIELLPGECPDLINLPSGLSRWFVEPFLVVEGKATPIPRELSDPKVRINLCRFPLEENYRQEVFRPALASHYHFGRCWAERSFETEVVEKVANEVVASLTEALKELKNSGADTLPRTIPKRLWKSSSW